MTNPLNPENVSKKEDKTVCCKRCGYETKVKCNLLKHLRKKEPCNPTISNCERLDLIDELLPKQLFHEAASECIYCKKKFNTSSNRFRHQRICKSNSEIHNNTETRFQELENEIMRLRQELSHSKSTTINGNNNTNNGTINNYNISIHNFGDEKITYLKDHPNFDKFMIKCIKTGGGGVLDFITRKHFHPEHPENHTICKLNKKDDFIEIRSGKEWKLRFKEDVLDDVFIKIESVFAEFIEQAFTDNGTLKCQWLDKFMSKVGEPLEWDLNSENYEYNGDMTEEEKKYLKDRIYKLVVEGIYRNTKEMKTKVPSEPKVSVVEASSSS